MDSAYSPHDAHHAPSRSSPDFPRDNSPPLVPVPDRADDRRQSYDNVAAAYGERAGHHHGHHGSVEPRDPYYNSRGPPPPPPGPPGADDPYGAPPPPRRDYPDYPPRPDYYGRPQTDYYGRPIPPPPPPPPPPGYPPHRDAWGYPPRDPYGYPPRGDPYYGGAPPPRDPYYPPPPGRDPYYGGPPPSSASVPPPPPPGPGSAGRGSVPPTPSSASVPPPPPPPPAAAAGAPSYGPAPDPNDLSIPLLYLARSVSLKTFTPIRGNYPNLDARFINSLLQLNGELAAVKLEHPNLLGHRRRVWVTAVGGTDALVHRVRGGMVEVLDWREAGDLQELERELAIEDRRVVVVREEMAEKARRAERDESERREREQKEEEMERGRREIEQRERERDGAGEGVVKSEPQELDEVLRLVRGDAAADANAAAPPPAEADGESPNRARKRSRRESEGEPDEVRSVPSSLLISVLTFPLPASEQDRELRRAARKKLEAVCKTERRRCGDFALAEGLPVDDETRMADDEPQLGERHKGVWDLFGQPLEDVSPQIQVLMARALRDATYPPRLRLYDTPDALEQLETAVPWFVALLNLVKDRYELAGASTLAPQDPPPAAHPFATPLPESSREVPTLGTLPFQMPASSTMNGNGAEGQV
ncbi:hypothetical protein JCM6882_009645 [Rhodosporidiobolus microsporus]